jgi:hypothetical protein
VAIEQYGRVIVIDDILCNNIRAEALYLLELGIVEVLRNEFAYPLLFSEGTGYPDQSLGE